MDRALVVENVRREYCDFVALDGVSLAVDGETVFDKDENEYNVDVIVREVRGRL